MEERMEGKRRRERNWSGKKVAGERRKEGRVGEREGVKERGTERGKMGGSEGGREEGREGRRARGIEGKNEEKGSRLNIA